MYESILSLHSYWAAAVLGLLFIAALNALVGLSKKRAFLPKDRQIALIALIFSHIQLVIGVVLLLTSPKMDAAKQLGMGAVMKNADLRLVLVEHPLMNLIALMLITIGWSKHKKDITDAGKFKKIGYLYAVGLIILLLRLPWAQWLS